MAHLNYDSKSDSQYIDTRNQDKFQVGHLAEALNLNASNFKKYGKQLLNPQENIILILEVKDQSILNEYLSISKEEELPHIEGYLLHTDIPQEHLRKVETKSADEFLNNKGKFVLLDVRSLEEITRQAPQRNLLSIPLQDLPNRYQEIDEQVPLYILCGSGNRATAAASYLEYKNYEGIVIAGGMKAVQAIRKNNL